MSKENALNKLWEILYGSDKSQQKTLLFGWKYKHLRAVWQAEKDINGKNIAKPENLIVVRQVINKDDDLIEIAYALVDVIRPKKGQKLWSLRMRPLVYREPADPDDEDNVLPWTVDKGYSNVLAEKEPQLEDKDIPFPADVVKMAAIFVDMYQRGDKLGEYKRFMDILKLKWAAEKTGFVNRLSQEDAVSVSAANWSMGITIKGLGYQPETGVSSSIIRIPVASGTTLALKDSKTATGVHYTGLGIASRGHKNWVGPLGSMFLDTLFLDSVSFVPHTKNKAGEWPADGALASLFELPGGAAATAAVHTHAIKNKDDLNRRVVSLKDVESYAISEAGVLKIKIHNKDYTPSESISMLFQETPAGNQELLKMKQGRSLMGVLTGQPITLERVRDVFVKKAITPELVAKSPEDQAAVALKIFDDEIFLGKPVKKTNAEKEAAIKAYTTAVTKIKKEFATAVLALTKYSNSENVTTQQVRKRGNELYQALKPISPKEALLITLWKAARHLKATPGDLLDDPVVVYKTGWTDLTQIILDHAINAYKTAVKQFEASVKILDDEVKTYLGDGVYEYVNDARYKEIQTTANLVPLWQEAGSDPDVLGDSPETVTKRASDRLGISIEQQQARNEEEKKKKDLEKEKKKKDLEEENPAFVAASEAMTITINKAKATFDKAAKAAALVDPEQKTPNLTLAMEVLEASMNDFGNYAELSDNVGTQEDVVAAREAMRTAWQELRTEFRTQVKNFLDVDLKRMNKQTTDMKPWATDPSEENLKTFAETAEKIQKGINGMNGLIVLTEFYLDKKEKNSFAKQKQTLKETVKTLREDAIQALLTTKTNLEKNLPKPTFSDSQKATFRISIAEIPKQIKKLESAITTSLKKDLEDIRNDKTRLETEWGTASKADKPGLNTQILEINNQIVELEKTIKIRLTALLATLKQEKTDLEALAPSTVPKVAAATNAEIARLDVEIKKLELELDIKPIIAIILKPGKPLREILYGSAKPAAAVLYHLGSPGRIDVTRMREDPVYTDLRGPEISNLSNFSLEFYGSAGAALASQLSLGASIQAENLVPKAVTADGGRLEQTAFDYYYGAYWVDEYTGFETAGNGSGGEVASSPGNYITLPDRGAILYHIGASKIGSMAYDFGSMAQQISFDNPDFEIMLRAPVLEDMEAPPGSSRLSTSGTIILGLRLPEGGSGLYSLRSIAYAPRLVKM